MHKDPTSHYTGWFYRAFIPIITYRIVTGGWVMLWKLLLSACFDNVIPPFSISGHIWAFISVKQRKLSGPDTIKNTNNNDDWAAIQVNKSKAQMIFIRGHFHAFTQSIGARNRWECENIRFLCCIETIMLIHLHLLDERSLADQRGYWDELSVLLLLDSQKSEVIRVFMSSLLMNTRMFICIYVCTCRDFHYTMLNSEVSRLFI